MPNCSFGNVAKFRYLGRIATNRSLIPEEIRRNRPAVSSAVWKRKILNIPKLNFSVVLYGCETWSLTLREEYKLRMFDNRVLRRIFGPKEDEVIGVSINLHIEELHNLYSLPIILN
jgi:hypothetical protein